MNFFFRCRYFIQSSAWIFPSICVIALCPLLNSCATNKSVAGKPDDLVELVKIEPKIRLDIRYATTNNFTGKKVYPEARCFVRREVAQQLVGVQRELEGMGLGLKIYDGYRPLSIQKKFWSLVPDERYVANPAKGSKHNRGAALDLTIVRRDGTEIPMPTGYDDFTEKAYRNYMTLSPEVLKNRELLEKVMTKHGFIGFPTEWWHFDSVGWEKFPIMDVEISQIR